MDSTRNWKVVGATLALVFGIALGLALFVAEGTQLAHGFPPPDVYDLAHGFPPPDIYDFGVMAHGFPPPDIYDFSVLAHGFPPPDVYDFAPTVA